MPGPKEDQATSELDRLRAEFLAEQGEMPVAVPAAGVAPPVAAASAGRRRKRRGGGGGGAARPRTGARVAAVQALYQSEYTGEPAEAVIAQFQRHRLGNPPGGGGFEDGRIPGADAPLFAAIVTGAARDGDGIDAALTAHLSAEWPLPKLDPVLRALLRAACAELSAGAEPPARVVINEYLDIAHGFFGGEEPAFANGVLNALARRLRPAEFAAAPAARPRSRPGGG